MTSLRLVMNLHLRQLRLQSKLLPNANLNSTQWWAISKQPKRSKTKLRHKTKMRKAILARWCGHHPILSGHSVPQHSLIWTSPTQRTNNGPPRSIARVPWHHLWTIWIKQVGRSCPRTHTSNKGLSRASLPWGSQRAPPIQVGAPKLPRSQLLY